MSPTANEAKSSPVTRPTLRMVRSTDTSGQMPETEMGASPYLGMETSKNWPGLTSPSYAMTKVCSRSVCSTMASTFEAKGT